MRGLPKVALLTATLLLGSATASEACTTFLLRGDRGPVVAKSYDWDNGLGAVLINKRGVSKRALAVRPGDRPAVWTSRYGSVTFNQYGRELPNGGMNEAGLVVEIMWLQSSRYPPPDDRPTVNELQWIQHQLDRHATVAEVLAHARDLRISLVQGKVHYLVCDAGGACATVEVLEGKIQVRHGEDLPVPVLTNHTYAKSLVALRRYRSFGGDRRLPSGRSSLARFVRAATASRARPAGKAAADRAFEVLAGVSQGDYTKWNIVYEPKRLELRFRTRDQPAIKTLRLRDFDLDCASPVQMLDLDTAPPGDVRPRFRPYSVRANRALVQTSIRRLGGRWPSFLLELLVRYPETTRCRAPTSTPAERR